MNHYNDRLRTQSSGMLLEVRTAREFMTVLLPDSGVIPEKPLYRGHCDANWKLLPTAIRPGGGIVDGSARSLAQQVAEERRLIEEFLKACRQQGKSIPPWNEVLTSWAHDALWPPAELVPAMALAQHHGVPTRLLDWTRDPHIACYFAAMGWEMAYRRAWLSANIEYGAPVLFGCPEIAVWVCGEQIVKDRFSGIIYLPLSDVTNNENLSAQKGQMMYTTIRGSEDSVFEPESIDQQVSVVHNPNADESQVFLKVVLKHKKSEGKAPGQSGFDSGEISNLLIELDHMGISEATVFPNFDAAGRQSVTRNSLDHYERLAMHSGTFISDEPWFTDARHRLCLE